MKKAVLCGLLSVLAGLAFVLSGRAADPAVKSPSAGKLRHVVLLKFKDGTKAEDVKKIERGFAALPSKIPAIKGFEWGTDVSVEGLSQDFTHCFVVTFDDAKGRSAYLPHPAHKALVAIVKPHVDKVLVIDYVAK